MRDSSRAGYRAHPRSRGENPRGAPGPDVDGGSSPLTRGKRRRDAQALPRRRAHPRSRGENSSGVIGVPCAMGSSPLTRGKPAHPRWPVEPLGLIPAHAGKTRSSPWLPSPSTAHPRSRGENLSSSSGLDFAGGSSPLTRGKPANGFRAESATRLIPAHAGKTRVVVLCAGQVGAHPRSRGENWISGAQLRGSEGSSPLTRGKQSCPLR